MLDKAGITQERAALCGASGQAFYNTSPFTLRDLKARANQQQLKADFETYLDGFSPNVQDILNNFEFHNIIPRLSKADSLGTLLAKFLDAEINLSPNPVLHGHRSVKHPAMDNHSMGTVFEELVRKFNEENNEEAGEHWTPRDAGQGESNIRRWLLENDWLEAIVALPLNMFYNIGIASYIWVLSNRKTAHRKGKVQLIDAAQWFKPLRKNLGKKNCELSSDDIRRVCDIYRTFQETEQSKIFPNEAFGYWKITVERPLRLHSQITPKAVEALRFASGEEAIRAELYDRFGDKLFSDFAQVKVDLERALAEWGAGDEAEETRKAKKRPPGRGCLRRKRKSCSTPKAGSATASSLTWPRPCGRNSAAICSRTTTFSATASRPLSKS